MEPELRPESSTTPSRNLPDDPNDDYYLTNCFVCQEVAKAGQVLLKNQVKNKFDGNKNDNFKKVLETHAGLATLEFQST